MFTNVGDNVRFLLRLLSHDVDTTGSFIHSMDDIELKNIQLQFPSARRFSGEGGCVEVRVRTDRGDIVVAVQGDRSKPAIITYHDLGLNCKYLPS